MTTTHIRPDWVVPPKPENIGDIYKVVGYPYDGATEYGAANQADDGNGHWYWELQLGDGDCFPWTRIEQGNIMADSVELVRRNPLPAREHKTL